MNIEKFYLNKYSLDLLRAHIVCIVHSNMIRFLYIDEEKSLIVTNYQSISVCF